MIHLHLDFIRTFKWGKSKKKSSKSCYHKITNWKNRIEIYIVILMLITKLIKCFGNEWILSFQFLLNFHVHVAVLLTKSEIELNLRFSFGKCEKYLYFGRHYRWWISEYFWKKNEKLVHTPYYLAKKKSSTFSITRFHLIYILYCQKIASELYACANFSSESFSL